MSGDAPLPPPSPGGGSTGPPTALPGGPTGSSPKPWWRRWWAITLAALVVLIIVLAIAGGSSPDNESEDDDNSAATSSTETLAANVTNRDDRTNATSTVDGDATSTLAPVTEVAGGDDQSNSTSTAVDTQSENTANAIVPDPTPPATPNGGPVVGGAADEIDDVAPCTLIDSETVLLDVTNNSSEQSSYIIDVNYLDETGQRVGDEPFFVNYVRPGERALEPTFVFDTGGGSACEIAEVDRISAESTGNLAEVTCEVTGVDFGEDIATALTVTNSSSELSDYFVTGTLVRDGVRVGTVSGFIENVQPGASAPGEGFSTVDGPAEGVTCEVVNVDRTSST